MSTTNFLRITAALPAVTLLTGCPPPKGPTPPPKKAKAFIPSSMGLGLACIMPFANAIAFFIGACIAEIWVRVSKKTAEQYLVAVASGAIAGAESREAGTP